MFKYYKPRNTYVHITLHTHMYTHNNENNQIGKKQPKQKTIKVQKSGKFRNVS